VGDTHGESTALLRQVRNNLGPSGLLRLKVPPIAEPSAYQRDTIKELRELERIGVIDAALLDAAYTVVLKNADRSFQPASAMKISEAADLACDLARLASRTAP
jgi:hypothetical protein